MKKLVTILLVMAMVMVSANFATAGVFKKGDKAEEVVQTEENLVDYMTPMNTLISEYYKIVAQIKQLDNQIEALETQLERLDAVIKYQQGIERKIQSEQVKEE